MPSQYHEDQIVAEFFGDRVGKFIDVGAHDGAINSNVQRLFERGWSGLCVEPSPMVFPYLLQNVRNFPGVRCVNAAIDDQCRMVEFHENNGDQMSTIDDEHRRIWIDRGSRYSGSFLIQTVTPAHLLHACPGPYLFVSIDTEGTNLRVLQAFPLHAIGCELVCVEKEPGDAMVNWLRSVGYGEIRETSGNYLASRG